ncbi:MAG TPA: hypothetical protein VH370_15230 [Humisphaera sp.]|jgi:hypothetical protein|nr:hypothetical protein [Humisphaera sp.]
MKRARQIVWLFGAGLLLLMASLWIATTRHAYVLAVRDPSGHLAGAAAERKGILFVLTQIDFDGEFGPDDSENDLRGKRFSFITASADEMLPLHDQIFDPASIVWSIFGFSMSGGTLSIVAQSSPRYSAIIVPYWFLVLLTAVPTIVAGRSAIRRRRWRRLGLCMVCGYDIRASTSLCPECGSSIQVHAKS